VWAVGAQSHPPTLAVQSAGGDRPDRSIPAPIVEGHVQTSVNTEALPLVAEPPQRSLRQRIAWWCIGASLRLSLLVSPRPTALLVRRVFATGGARTAAVLERHAPPGVDLTVDMPYGDGPDALLDIYRPASASEALPLVLWVHGGGWVGGTKEEIAGWCERIAHEGFVVVAPRYSLAPEHRYPAPLRQMMEALAHLQAHDDRLGIDTSRIVIGGDSAGAQIAAQLGVLVTRPKYAEQVGVSATIGPGQLRGLVLACGPYDLGLDTHASSAAGRRLVHALLWAYSGKRHPFADARFALASVVDHVTSAYPPTLITAGNADPLRSHSESLVERLRAVGTDPETVFFARDHRPPLGHEYQFDLDGDAGRLFLDRTLGFLRRRLA